MSASDITITESSITVPLWNFPDPSWTPAAREAFVASLTPGTVATPNLSLLYYSYNLA